MGLSPSLRQISPDELRIAEGGGCLSLFGLPFLAGGLFAVLAATGVIPLSNAQAAGRWSWLGLLLMGLVFVAAGTALVFGRRWTTLDRGQGVVRRQRGLLVPMRGEELPLHGFEAVVLDLSPGDADAAATYPVSLRAAAGGRADLALVAHTLYGRSREQAGAIAAFLRLPLVDATTPHESALPADRIDASLQERLRSGEESLEPARARPSPLRSTVTVTGRAVEIVLPRPGLPRGRLVACAVAFGVVALLAPGVRQFFVASRTPEFVQWFFGGFGVLLLLAGPFAGLVGGIVTALRGRSALTASPEGIVIAVRSAWRTQVTRIPAADILGLDYGTTDAVWSAARSALRRRAAGADRSRGAAPPAWLATDGSEPRWATGLRRLVRSQGILIKSRGGLASFGAGLPDEETRYLHGLVARALAGREGAVG